MSHGRAVTGIGTPTSRGRQVATWWDATYFTDAERVALEMVEAVLTPNPSGERVPDELYARASAHYDDKAMWSLVMAIAHIGFFTPAALIAKPIPTRSRPCSRPREQGRVTTCADPGRCWC